MQRVLEPEYMDTPEEVASYAAMDHGSANELVVAAFVAAGGGRGRTLDIGTGPGDIPILLARQVPGAHIVAIDAAQHMLDFARRQVTAAGLADRIELQQADAKRLPFADDSFDGVLSNTILHHIPEPLALLREAARVARPDAVIVIRDLYRPATEADARALVREHAAAATEEQQRLLFDSLCAALTLDEARSAVAAAGLVGATVEMTSDRHYTILRKPL